MAPPAAVCAGGGSLPADCLLHVFLRLDPVSMARCAAVSRHWRRAVIENASEIRRHHPMGRRRALLLGLHYREMFPGELGFSRRSSWLPSSSHWSDGLPVPSLMPSPAQGTSTKTKLYAPLACSDGLLLVCRGLPSELSVVNPFTGFHTSIPRPCELVTNSYLLHSCGGESSSSSSSNFQVLAAKIRDGVAFQNYRSETGAWGPVLRPNNNVKYAAAAPLVCQGAIHWLCRSYASSDYWRQITHTVAVDIATGQARMTRLPERCSLSHHSHHGKIKLMLATAAAAAADDDRLSVLRTDKASLDLEVSVWLHVGGGDDHGDGGGDWLLWRSINTRKLIQDAGLSRFRLSCKDWAVLQVRLEWFCPRSRCLIFWVPYLGLLVLDMDSMQIQRAAGDCYGHIWPYEIDLLTLCLSSIKPFY